MHTCVHSPLWFLWVQMHLGLITEENSQHLCYCSKSDFTLPSFQPLFYPHLQLLLSSHKRIIHNPHTLGGVTFQFCKILTTATSFGNAGSLLRIWSSRTSCPLFCTLGYKDSGHLRLSYLCPRMSRAQLKAMSLPAPIRIFMEDFMEIFHLGDVERCRQ